MKTRDVMTTPAQCCSPNDSLEQVAEMMWDYELHAIPAVDARGRPVGWVTDRAICMTTLRAGARLADLEARQALLLGIPAVHQDLPAGRLAEAMTRCGSEWLVVVDDAGVVTGVVTVGDLARASAPASRMRLTG